MILQKRVERALNHLREKSEARKGYDTPHEEISLERWDKLAMILSALLVIVPAALVVLLIMVGAAALWML